MRALTKSLFVLTLAAGLAVGVIYLERTYAPHAIRPSADLSDAAAADGEERPLDELPPGDGVPGRPAADLRSLADLARRLPWNLTNPKASFADSAVGWMTDALSGRSPAGWPPQPAAGTLSGVVPVEPTFSDRLPTSTNILRPTPDFDEPDANRPARLGNATEGVRRASLVQDAAHPAASALGPLRRVDLFDLLRQLRASDQQVAAAARAELLRRGLSEVDLELGRRLFDPDPEVRRQLVRALPAMQSVDAATWLLRLCRDEDPEVRMAAVTLMGTTGDPRLLEQVEALIEHDSDARIKELAEQIAQQREIIAARAGGAARPQPHMARGGTGFQR